MSPRKGARYPYSETSERRRRTPIQRARDAGLVLGALAVIVVGGLVGFGKLQRHHARSAASPDQISPTGALVVPTAGARGPLSVWLADNWPAGGNSGGYQSGVAALTAAAQSWSWNLAIEPGSGYTNAGLASQTPGSVRFADSVTRVAALKPQIVIAEGGINDAANGATVAAVIQGVSDVVSRLRSALPGVPVVIIGPVWADGFPPTSVRGVNNAVRVETTALKVPFIDPIDERWVTGHQPTSDSSGDGTAAQYASKNDGASPTLAGARAYAQRIVEDLHKLGVTVTSR